MEGDYRVIVERVGKGVEVIGVAIIVVGLLYATWRFLQTMQDRPFSVQYRSFRRSLGRSILLGLEFLVAGDIISTVAVDPTFRSVGVLAIVVAIVFAFNLGRGSVPDTEEASQTTGASESPRAEPAPVPIASVSDFDPTGDGQENPETAQLAVDGRADTAWTTVTYFDPLPLQKEGVGLLVNLGEPVEVADVGLRLGGSPTSVELLVPREASNTAPTDLDGLRRVARVTDAGEEVRLDPEEPVTTEFLVVWLTDLPAVGGDFRGEVAEIVVRA